jgi:hypothetical protein
LPPHLSAVPNRGYCVVNTAVPMSAFSQLGDDCGF